MRFEYDERAKALYLRMRVATVAETVEVADDVYLDVDNDGKAIGVEFVNAEEFFQLLALHGGSLEIPDQVAMAHDHVAAS